MDVDSPWDALNLTTSHISLRISEITTSQTEDLECELLITGFIHESQNHLHLQYIPSVIHQMIFHYYIKYLILGIGCNRWGQLGLKHKKIVSKYIKLIGLQDIVHNIHNIYYNFGGLIVISSHNKIYVAGNNNYSRLGIFTNKSRCYIDRFTELSSQCYINIKFNDKPILASKGLFNQGQTFIYTLNRKLYGNGLITTITRFRSRTKSAQKLVNYAVFSPIHPKSLFLMHKNNDYIIDIACNDHATYFLTKNGIIWRNIDRTNLICQDLLQFVLPYKIIAISCIIGGFLIGITEFNDVTYFNIDGQIKIWKYFRFNQLKIKSVECAEKYAVCIDFQGKCHMFILTKHRKTGYWKRLSFKFDKDLDNDNDFVTTVSCGRDHTVLLTNNNNIVSFGDNRYNQCSKLLNIKRISSPYYMSKLYDLEINEISLIEKVMTLDGETIVIINPFKKIDSKYVCNISLERSINSYSKYFAHFQKYINIFIDINNLSNEEFRFHYEMDLRIKNENICNVLNNDCFELFPKITEQCEQNILENNQIDKNDSLSTRHDNENNLNLNWTFDIYGM